MISGSQADLLMKQLTGANFRFTLMNSTGGILQDAMLCLMIGFSHERLPALLDIIHSSGRTYKRFIPTQGMLPMEQAALPMMEAQLGGATIYMLNVDRFEQI
jgi:uncharacterized protein YaaQ